MIRLTRKAPADGERLEIAGAPVRFKVNRGARRISLRVDRVHREIVAIAPNARRLAEAAAFAQERAGWIAARMAELPQASPVDPGAVIEVFGEPVHLQSASGRAKWLAADEAGPARILAMGEGEGFSRAVVRQVKIRALAVLTERTVVHAGRLGAALPVVAVGDPRARWGSCTLGGPGRTPSIRYSWRLALAPFETADYVAAHECAHLLEQNHGPRFWAHVKALGFDSRPHRAWLREHGARLHAFGR